MVYEECAFEISKLAYDGPTEEDLQWYYDMFVRQAQNPESAAATASQNASNELVGYPVRTDAEVAAMIKSVDPVAVGDAIGEMSETLFWLLPFEAPIEDRRLGHLPQIEHDRVKGKKIYRAKGVEKDEKYQRLIFSPEGFTYIDDDSTIDGYVLTILKEELVGGYQFRDGRLLVWASSGRTFVVHPNDWEDPTKVFQGMQSLMGGEKWVMERDFTTKERSRFDYGKAAA